MTPRRRLHGGRVAPAGRPLHPPLLVGRERELASLLHAATNPPALHIIEREAGTGKTRLLDELRSSEVLEARRLLTGRTHRIREPFPLGPIIEGLRAVGSEPPATTLSPIVGSLERLLPELAGQLPHALAPLADARAEQHRVFRAILELLWSLGPSLAEMMRYTRRQFAPRSDRRENRATARAALP